MKKWLFILSLIVVFAAQSFAALTNFNSIEDIEVAPDGAEKEMAKCFLIAGQMLKLDMSNKKGWNRVRDIFMFKKSISKQEAFNAQKAQPELKVQEGDRLSIISGEGPSVRLEVDKANK